MGFSSGTPWVARAFGSDLLAHLAATFEQLTATRGGAAIGGLGSRPTDKLVYYAGEHLFLPPILSVCAACFFDCDVSPVWRVSLCFSRP
jgi:hypothetical protein